MHAWTVQLTVDEEEQVEAALLATEGGTLIALSEEGVVLRAWAARNWRTVRLSTCVEAHPAGKGNGKNPVLIGLPRS
jgi:hypothetical protein